MKNPTINQNDCTASLKNTLRFVVDLTVLVKFNIHIHKEVIRSRKKESSEVDIYVNLWSCCFKEATSK